VIFLSAISAAISRERGDDMERLGIITGTLALREKVMLEAAERNR